MTLTLVVGLLGAVGLLVQELRRRAAEARAAELEDRARDIALELEITSDDVERLEAVITDHRARIERAQEDLRACAVPGAVRDALRVLFDDPRGAAAGAGVRVDASAGETPPAD